MCWGREGGRFCARILLVWARFEQSLHSEVLQTELCVYGLPDLRPLILVINTSGVLILFKYNILREEEKDVQKCCAT